MTISYNDAGKTSIADGTIVTATNTTGGGNTAVGIGGNLSVVKRAQDGPPVADTGYYESGPFNATTDTGYLTLSAGTYTAATGGGVGMWVCYTGFPTVNTVMLRFGNSGKFYVGVTPTGKHFLVSNGTVIYTSIVTCDLFSWYWLSHSMSSASTTTGIMRFGMRDSFSNVLDGYTVNNIDTTPVTVTASLCGRSSTTGTQAPVRIAGLRVVNTTNSIMVPPTGRGRGWGDVAA